MKIKIQNIEFAYNGSPVLKNINAEIAKGDFVALVGPNGSGKSTLMKNINRVLKSQKGKIYVNSKLLDDISDKQLAKEMAYVPQSSKPNSGLNVFDTILTGRKPYINFKPKKRDIATVKKIIQQLKIEDISFKDFSKLSGGQQQIVLIARALAQDADVILLDEPTSNLDIKNQLEVLELLKSFTKEGITIIVAIHDINMAVKFADKFLMLKKGEVFNFGGKELIEKTVLKNLYDVNLKVFNDEEHLYVVPAKDL